jgi:hypothetical protein
VKLVRLAARDRTDAAIAKPETPFVRVDELGDQISGNAWRSFHMDKSRLRARDRLRRLRASGGALFAFSAKTGSDDLSSKQMPKSVTRADSLMREKISLIARFNSLQGLKKFPVRTRRELAHKALS